MHDSMLNVRFPAECTMNRRTAKRRSQPSWWNGRQRCPTLTLTSP
jgi:hypothetical protein